MKTRWVCGEPINYYKLNDNRIKFTWLGNVEVVSIAKIKKFLADTKLLEYCDLSMCKYEKHLVPSDSFINNYYKFFKNIQDFRQLRLVKRKLRQILKNVGAW